LLYGTRVLFGIESSNALPNLLFSNLAVMSLIGFNARQVKQGMTQRGDKLRTGASEYALMDPQTLASTICKASAQELEHLEVTPEIVREYLKKEKFESESSENIEIPGIATGLAVTAVGGDILFIEATSMKGKGALTLTGQLGDVMRESAQIAHSFVRSKASELGIEPGLFEKMDVHLHVPAGAIPKDGPSAGVAMVMAIASLFCRRPVRSEVGMTGEVTLRGRVMPVGGIKMKILAAHRAGLTTVILPKRNERDLEELPEDVREAVTFVPVDRIDEALKVGLLPDGALSEVPEMNEWLRSLGAAKGGSLN